MWCVCDRANSVCVWCVRVRVVDVDFGMCVLCCCTSCVVLQDCVAMCRHNLEALWQTSAARVGSPLDMYSDA